MKKSFFLFITTILITLFVSSCGTTSSEPREIVTNAKFKMQIPGNMSSANRLNEDASMIYAHMRQELYVMVIEDPFEELETIIVESDLEEEYSLNFDLFCKLVSNEEEDAFLIVDDRDKLKETTINGLKARFFENSRKVNGVNIFYKIALIEGKDTYYQVIAWTITSKKDRHDTTLKNMIYSFEELSSSNE